MKNTRKILVSSLIMILTCVCLFAATTFAWFSDSVSSNNNIIKAGNLDIELEYSFDAENWAPVAAETSILSADDLWEPGFTKVVYFKVINNGSLNLKYSFNANVLAETAGINVYGNEFLLSDYLKVGAADFGATALTVADRATYVAAATKALENRNVLASNVVLNAGEVNYGWMVITMPTTVGNEANAKTGTEAPSIQVGFDLLASQTNAEATTGEAAVPTATIVKSAAPAKLDSSNALFYNGSQTEAQLECDYSFQTQDNMADVEKSEYRNWHADYVVTLDAPLPANSLVLAGQYDAFGDSWLAFSNEDLTLDANTPVRLLYDVAGLLLGSEFYLSYEEVVNNVKEFKCGATDLDDKLSGVTMTVQLVIYETYTEEECMELFGYKSTNEETGTTKVLATQTHTFGREFAEVATASELAAAIANGGSVRLTSDVVVEEVLNVAQGTSVYLDLNGKTLSTALVAGSTTNHLYAFENHGNLTITGNGRIEARGNFNYGNMTLENGTIVCLDGNGGYGVRSYDGTFVMNGGSIEVAVEDDYLVDKGGNDATPVRVDAGAKFVMNGGSLVNIADFTACVENYGLVIIENGSLTSVHSTIVSKGEVRINGGSFVCNGNDNVSSHVLVLFAGTAVINGGTFDGKDNNNGYNVFASEGSRVVINGGNFLEVYSGHTYGDVVVNGGIFA